MQIFNKFFKKFSKVFDEYIFAECPPFEPKFWRHHCSTGLELNSCIKFCPMFPLPKPKSWRRLCHRLISIHISTVICTLSQKNKTLSMFQKLWKNHWCSVHNFYRSIYDKYICTKSFK